MTIECRIAGGRMLLPKEEGGEINGEMRPMTKDDAECFAAWNRDPLAASLASGLYVVRDISGDDDPDPIWHICAPDGAPVVGAEIQKPADSGG